MTPTITAIQNTKQIKIAVSQTNRIEHLKRGVLLRFGKEKNLLPIRHLRI